MQYRKTWLILLLVALMALWGCSDDDDGPTTPAQTAFEVVAEAASAYVNSTDCPGVIGADVLYASLDDYTVIDIRAEADYLDGHIPGAYNSSLGTLLTDIESMPVPVEGYVVVCYTGQSAGHAKIALELMGYDPVYSLKFGMCSWNSSLSDRWNNAIGDHADFTAETTNNNGELTEHAFPEITGSVADRVNAMLAGGFQAVSFSSISDDLDNYFIINYFTEDQYDGTAADTPGHIEGAYQFTPRASLGLDQMLNNLPTDQDIVVYCWTGQTSSQITAYLNMLGYHAFSLAYGANALFHTELLNGSHAWQASDSYDYELEMGPMATGDFAALAAEGAEYINSAACPGPISAVALHANLVDYTVIDIRSQTDYDNGHIPGAYHSDLNAVLTNIADGTIPGNKDFVIACYTGQSACMVKCAMELVGYHNVQWLQWGMSAWSPDVTGNNWVGNSMVADLILDSAETTDNNPDLEWQTYPETTGDMASRVQAVLDEGFGAAAITYAAMEDDGLENYFIINYFGELDYLGQGTAGVPGHIPGAYQFTPRASLGLGQMLGYLPLPADKTIVVYCWTGQTSAQVATYLKVLGYDAKTMVYGANNLFHSSLSSGAWDDSYVQSYELEVTD
ncbi:MAG: rhodanese-like domain-containing protein [Candidatus Krumholzibacteriia bacterium]